MSGEVSYSSRFFVKFVEIIAAGLASGKSRPLVFDTAGRGAGRMRRGASQVNRFRKADT
jgi:hypothetical protein